MTRFDLWNAIGWLMTGVAIVLAAAGYVALLVSWPVWTGLASSYVVVVWGTWWLTGRNLRAELEAVRERLATYNASENHDDLAAVGPVTPPRGTDEMDVPDYVAPRCRGCSGTPTLLRADGVWLCDDCDDHTRRFLARQAQLVHLNAERQALNEADPFDYVGIRGELPTPPPRMTGERDTDAADRELTDIYGICPEAGGCRREPECAETGCYWRRLDVLNRPLTDQPKVSD